MGYTRTDHYEKIIQRQIRSGRASNKTEVIHQDEDLIAGRDFIGGTMNAPLIFYEQTAGGVEIKRVLYGNVNWRQEPGRFF